MFCFCQKGITDSRGTYSSTVMCVTPGPTQFHPNFLIVVTIVPYYKFNCNENSVRGIIWSVTLAHSNPQAQSIQLHPVTRKPSSPVIPVTTILGTSRMVPNDAVLRWPRLYCGRAVKKHIHTHTYSCVQNKHAD